MMKCNKCGQIAVRQYTKGELRKESKKLGPVTMALGTGTAAAAAKRGPDILLGGNAVATKGPRDLIIAGLITAAAAAIGASVKHLLDRRADNKKTYRYCISCGFCEAM